MLKGIDVILYEKAQSSVDPFGNPVYTETTTTVSNVLVGEPSSDDVINSVQLYGKKLVYTLAIPKGDEHNWEDTKVSFFGKTFHTFGAVTQGIEEMVPLDWNKKIKVELYE